MSQDFLHKIEKHLPPPATRSDSIPDQTSLAAEIKRLLKEKNAVLIAHYYTDADVQQLAEESGGFIGDSLEMARFGAESSAQTLVVAGVRFMGETAKILSPHKTVLMPDLKAECSLDLGCEPDEFKKFIAANPGRTVVVYANTSAEVKAMADWVVTSSMAVDLIKHLTSLGEKVIWAPDRYLGDYIKRQSNGDILLWDACCVIHAEFDAEKISQLQERYPDAEVLVHPESKPEVIALADVVGSTSQLLKAAQKSSAKRFIVATETGVFYKMQQTCPGKKFYAAGSEPYGGRIDCEANCPWMKMNRLDNLLSVLKTGNNEIELAKDIIQKALVPLTRMLEFRKKN
jgi:quinolinate synthase